MVFLSVAIGLEIDHVSVGEKRKSMTLDRRVDLLRDHVVRQQHVGTAVQTVEDEHIVFAVGRSDSSLEQQVGILSREGFVLAALQVISVRENQPVVFRQQDAGTG